MQYSNVICKTIKSGPRVGYSCVQEIRLVNKILLQSCLIFVSYLARFVNEDAFLCTGAFLYLRYMVRNIQTHLPSPPPPPSLSQSTVYTDSVWLGGGVGVLSYVGDHILQGFSTLYLTRFRTYKIARPPQTKT